MQITKIVRFTLVAVCSSTLNLSSAAPAAAQRSGVSNESVPCRLSRSPSAVLGRSVGTEFGTVEGAAFVNDSVLVIGDRLAATVTFFAVSGRRLAQSGRGGSGPGEFRSIQRVSATGDTAVVYDRLLQRVSLISSQGGFERSFQSILSVLRLLPGGAMVLTTTSGTSTFGRSGPWLWPDTVEVWVEDARGDSRSITRIQGQQRLIETTPGMSILPAPFSPEPSIAANAEQIIVADGTGVIWRYRTDGARIGSVRSPFPAETVSREDFARWVEHGVAEARAENQAIRRRLYGVASPPPRRAPAHGRVVVDRGSTIWIQEYRAPYDTRPAAVVALNSTNQVVLRETTPANRRLLAASPVTVAFLAKDELDVQTVVIHTVECT